MYDDKTVHLKLDQFSRERTMYRVKRKASFFIRKIFIVRLLWEIEKCMTRERKAFFNGGIVKTIRLFDLL